MGYTTYVKGEIDLVKVPKDHRVEIKRLLEQFFGEQQTKEIFQEDFITIDDYWDTHEETDEFMQLLALIVPHLTKTTVSRLFCEGETHNDYWGVVIKKNKLFIQRYNLEPVGEPRPFVYVQKPVSPSP